MLKISFEPLLNLTSTLLYSTGEPPGETPSNDANYFPPLKLVDSTMMHRIISNLEALGDNDEGEHLLLVYLHLFTLFSSLCFGWRAHKGVML